MDFYVRGKGRSQSENQSRQPGGVWGVSEADGGQGRGQRRGRGAGRSRNNEVHHRGYRVNPDVQPSRPDAMEKFRKAQEQMKAASEKLVAQEEYSSEEEDLDGNSILGSVLQSYSRLGGKAEDLGRTQRFLEDAFQSGAAVCLICISTVKRTDAIWSCKMCFCFLHLTCIQQWAKNSIFQQKKAMEDQPRHIKSQERLAWPCPKCRHNYDQSSTPQSYRCFCGQVLDPPYHPWLVPHSCGEVCGKNLEANCGHDCLLLCHPGPCPPCPKMVKCSCHCGKRDSQVRCSNKSWACGAKCGQVLQCGKHVCGQACHPNKCQPCTNTSLQSCECGARTAKRECASPNWQCEQVCRRALVCGNHCCERLCHSGPCGDCPLSLARPCPCGGATYVLPCTQDTPTCGNTCGRPLACGIHTCPRGCHRGDCGSCLEVATKSCRCGQHTKELSCHAEYLCGGKCKRYRDCMRHPCNRRCCDGNCPPCEKVCGRTLQCGNHKCESVCHLGPCYPCQVVLEKHCTCASTVYSVPCGLRRRTKPPQCQQPCRLGPLCTPEHMNPHRCHAGPCPPCAKQCGLPRDLCPHPCKAPCHWAVTFTWSKKPKVTSTKTDCPLCKFPVAVTCFGGHETSDWPCHSARPSSCQRPCGRQLVCGNHTCTLACHAVDTPEDLVTRSSSCESCDSECLKPRPEGCSHPCRKPCHRLDCEPCPHMLRMRCHCGLNQVFAKCGEWTALEEDQQVARLSCSNQCPRSFDCGHRCRANCHLGDCPNSELCHKKVKVHCPCKRLRREFPCNVVRAKEAKVPCDEVCMQDKEREQKARELKLLNEKLEVERKNQEELERFQKKFQPRKKRSGQYSEDSKEEESFFARHWLLLTGAMGVVVALGILVLLWKP